MATSHSASESASRVDEPLPLEGSTGTLKIDADVRRVGDVWVHRFSGSYRGDALILKEEVLAKRDGIFVVDYTLTGAKEATHLRVHLGARSERVVAVFRVQDGQEIPATIHAYDAMIEKTLFVPDRNDGKVAEKSETCLVGQDEFDCDMAAYEVMVEDRQATLRVSHNREWGRDVAGEVTAVDGTVLYHAELLEMQRGQEAPSSAQESVAVKGMEPWLD